VEPVERNTQVKGAEMIKKIISGGQTGADRAALDVAIEAKTDRPKCQKAKKGWPVKNYWKD